MIGSLFVVTNLLTWWFPDTSMNFWREKWSLTTSMICAWISLIRSRKSKTVILFPRSSKANSARRNLRIISSKSSIFHRGTAISFFQWSKRKTRNSDTWRSSSSSASSSEKPIQPLRTKSEVFYLFTTQRERIKLLLSISMISESGSQQLR